MEFKPATIYMLRGTEGEKRVETTEGYLIDLVDHKGFQVKIGIFYKYPYWRAVHYETGLGCTPLQYAGTYIEGWANKEGLVEALKTLDFEALIKARVHFNDFRKIIDHYKQEDETNEP